MTPTPSSLTPKSSFRSRISWARATRGPGNRVRQRHDSLYPCRPGLRFQLCGGSCRNVGIQVPDCTLADLLRAADRFDSDCVVRTQFESSQAHHAFPCKQRFPRKRRCRHPGVERDNECAEEPVGAAAALKRMNPTARAALRLVGITFLFCRFLISAYTASVFSRKDHTLTVGRNL
jgi:hypothetical protein